MFVWYKPNKMDHVTVMSVMKTVMQKILISTNRESYCNVRQNNCFFVLLLWCAVLLITSQISWELGSFQHLYIYSSFRADGTTYWVNTTMLTPYYSETRSNCWCAWCSHAITYVASCCACSSSELSRFASDLTTSRKNLLLQKFKYYFQFTWIFLNELWHFIDDSDSGGDDNLTIHK